MGMVVLYGVLTSIVSFHLHRSYSHVKLGGGGGQNEPSFGLTATLQSKNSSFVCDIIAAMLEYVNKIFLVSFFC
jgi:hypothetical protein